MTGASALRAVCLAAALAVPSCRQEAPEDVLARVGDAVLTRRAANARIDTAADDYRRRLAAYIVSWVNTQLIYAEAKGSGVENTPAFTESIDDARRQLANQMFLDSYMKAESVDVGDAALRAYYGAHTAEFVVGEEMRQLNIASFDRRERATAFVARAVRDPDWSAALRASDSGAVVLPPRWFTQHTLFPPELWKAAAALGLKEVSFPIKTALGYVVVQPVAVARQGAQAEFDAVRDEVRDRLVMEHRNRRYRELLGTLRQHTSVEILPGADIPPPDTTSTSSHD